MGLSPTVVAERYYCARGPQLVNRIVDISATIDAKRRAICACRTQLRNTALRHRDLLAAGGRTLPILSRDDESLVPAYVDALLLEPAKRLGQEHGLGWAEAFHYVGEDPLTERYVRENSRPAGGR